MESDKTVIALYREAICLKKGEMADKLGVSYRTYRLLEDGTSKTGAMTDKIIRSIFGVEATVFNKPEIMDTYIYNGIAEYIADNPDYTWHGVFKTILHDMDTPEELRDFYVTRLEREGKIINKGGVKYRGVYKNGKKYCARLFGSTGNLHIGTFDTARQAAIAFDKAVIDNGCRQTVTNKKLGLL